MDTESRLISDDLTAETNRLKCCSTCGQKKPSKDFSRHPRGKYGVGSKCRPCEALYGQKRKKTAGGILSGLRGKAKERGLICGVTLPEFQAWWDNTPNLCHYCGSSLEQYAALRDFVWNYAGLNTNITKFRRCIATAAAHSSARLTIDRRDNQVGYELTNIVKSCWFCNSIKGNFFTERQTLILAPLIISELKHEVLTGVLHG